MRLTKFVHSCVLVDTETSAVLFDPGIFSWNSGLVKLESFPALNAVVISHGHSDHCAEVFVKELVSKFPAVQWFAPADIHEVLKSWGVQRVVNNSIGNVQVEEVAHAPVEPFAQQVSNLITSWEGLVTHPGDTHDFTQSNDILLLPIQAPWGTTIRAVKLALELKPKYVLPIHDWMWNNDWQQTVYDRLEQLFADSETTFLRPTDGQAIEVNN